MPDVDFSLPATQHRRLQNADVAEVDFDFFAPLQLFDSQPSFYDCSDDRGSMAAAASTSAPSSSSSKTVHNLETFRPLLKRLILAQPIPGVPSSSSHAVSQQHSQLSPADLDLLFEHLSDVEFTSNHAHQAPLGSTLTGLRLAGLDIRPETLLVASERFLSKSIPVDSCDGSNSLQAAEEVKRRLQDEPRWSEQANVSELVGRWTAYDGTLDLVGTGGDGQDTFNVSTTAAIVASGVPGVRVCKVRSGSGVDD